MAPMEGFHGDLMKFEDYSQHISCNIFKMVYFFFLIIFQKLSPSATQAIGQSVSQDEVKDLTDSRISPDVIERKSLHSTEVGEHVSFITLQFRCNCCLLVDPNQHNVCVG